MEDLETLCHTKWDCKSHVGASQSPGARRCIRSGGLAGGRGAVVGAAEGKARHIAEGHVLLDHGHRRIAIPPQYAVAQVVGFIKVQSATHLARSCMGRRQNSTGQHCWARGSYVATVGKCLVFFGVTDQTPVLPTRLALQLRCRCRRGSTARAIASTARGKPIKRATRVDVLAGSASVS